MKKTGKKRSAGVRYIYWPNCAVCQYMKAKPEFKYRIMKSTYFNPEGLETMMDVVHDFGDPFKATNMYAHMSRHQNKDLIKAAVKFDRHGNQVVDNRFAKTVEVLDKPLTSSTTNHELGLDDFIQAGRDKLAKNELGINAATFLQAIKIKADIESKTKDRRLDAIKTFFGGKSEQPNAGVSPPQGPSPN